MKSFLRYILLSTALLLGPTAKSQRYPVQATVQLSPPYSLYLADYAAPGSQRLGLNVLLRDLARPELQTRLRLTIESQGLRISTRTDYRPQPLFLQGGVPSILTADDLAPYFNPDHLDFRGITKQQVQKGGALPEGLYRICFEVLEYNSGIAVSNLGCATAWLVLNDPPLINLPANGDKLRAQEPQNILFQWTPRHTGSPNAAFATEYGFQLVELWPGNRDPNNAIQSMPPIFETTTFSTSLIYGPAETPLVPGRRYAFRVRARAMTGADRLDLFRNSGYSKVHTFTYGDNCTPPAGLEAKGISSTRVRLNWTSLPQHTGFTVRYRKADGNGRWKEKNTLLTEFTVEGLEPQTEYGFQILPLCGTVNGEATETVTAGTPARPTTDFTCGAEPGAFDLDNQEPLMELKYGDYIKAGDFDVMVTDVRGGNGTFSGRGLAVIPWMNSIKVRVEFNGIFVNSSYRLIKGGIKTVFNPRSKAVADLDALKDDKLDGETDTTGVDDGFDGKVVTIDGEVDTVTIDAETGDIIITLEGGGTQVVTTTDEKDGNGGDKGVMVVDASGDTWMVDGNTGQVTKNGNDAKGSDSGGSGQPGGPTIEEQLVTAVLEEFENDIDAWLDVNGKGPLDEREIAMLEKLPSCLPPHQIDLEYIRESVILKKMESTGDFWDDLKSNRDNENLLNALTVPFAISGQLDRQKIGEEEWDRFREVSCAALMEGYDITEAFAHRLEQEGSGQVGKLDCWGNAVSRYADFYGKFDDKDIAFQAGAVSFLICATSFEVSKKASATGAFTMGLANALLQELDWFALVEMAEAASNGTNEEKAKELLVCVINSYKLGTNIDQTKFSEVAFKCVTGISVDELKDKIKGFIAENWDEPYYQGQATGFVLTILSPFKGKLIEKLKNLPKYGGKMSKIRKLATAKGKDELVDIAESMTKVGGKIGKYDAVLIKRYFQHIQKVTGRSVPQNQINRIKDALRTKEYTKLSKADLDSHRADFNRKKNKLISEWEANTGQEWPKYTEPYYTKNAIEYKKVGDPYDAHHIIENQYGGDNEWWNIHPARFPDQHQGGIHGVGSPARELFK